MYISKQFDLSLFSISCEETIAIWHEAFHCLVPQKGVCSVVSATDLWTADGGLNATKASLLSILKMSNRIERAQLHRYMHEYSAYVLTVWDGVRAPCLEKILRSQCPNGITDIERWITHFGPCRAIRLHFETCQLP